MRAAELGATIKKHRQAKGWTQDRLARKVALSNTAIAHFESGARVPRRDVAMRIDQALEAGEEIWELRDALDDNPDAERVKRYLAQHSRAVRIRQICFSSIPAMLETEEHTRLALEDGLAYYGGDLNDKLEYRRQLRGVLEGPNAPAFQAVIWEPVLHVNIGGDKQVMRRQLLHLIDRSREAAVDVRVVPLSSHSCVPDIGFVSLWEGPDGRYTGWRPTSDSTGMFIRKESETARLNHLYDQLHLVALSAVATRDLIHKVVEEYYPCRTVSTCL
ncbi:Scr1 family TA system antitoxin-like transcriptional regulator [Streptomyces sp. NPDC052396]|uniref:helix-turn-helix domain-containing protein n=1 Tax=Streptomyces sp. NPDC052396 TaxID=3365689 RepID=UPI0037D5618B